MGGSNLGGQVFILDSLLHYVKNEELTPNAFNFLHVSNNETTPHQLIQNIYLFWLRINCEIFKYWHGLRTMYKIYIDIKRLKFARWKGQFPTLMSLGRKAESYCFFFFLSYHIRFSWYDRTSILRGYWKEVAWTNSFVRGKRSWNNLSHIY